MIAKGSAIDFLRMLIFSEASDSSSESDDGGLVDDGGK